MSFRYLRSDDSLEKLADHRLRMDIFLESARDACSREDVDSVALLMEAAFLAGIRMTLRDLNPRGKNRITDLDVPPQSRGELQRFRMYLGGDKSRDFDEFTCEDVNTARMAIFYNYATSMWYLAGGFRGRDSDRNWTVLSNRTIRPLLQLGFYEELVDLDLRWSVSFMTEWGFELIMTGETCCVADRRPGGSSTFEHYRRLTVDRDKLVKHSMVTAGMIEPLEPF